MLCALLGDLLVKGRTRGQDRGREPVTVPGHFWTGLSFLEGN